MSDRQNKVTYKCPAKINLFLKIVGHSNNYHQLESVLAKINLFDDLTIEKTSENFQLGINGQFAQYLDKKHNLFTQILDYFIQNYQINNNLKITLTKNIPVSAGLGGGSSNAAFFMMALNYLFKLNLTKEELIKLSFNFGSDIAFFLTQDDFVLVRNRGYIEKTLNNLKKPQLLLINPLKPLSTKEVFQNFADKYDEKLSNNIIESLNLTQLLNLENSLQKPATKLLHDIADILSTLKSQKAKIAKMSGSGASCFAIFENESDLKNCQKYFEANHPNYFTKIC